MSFETTFKSSLRDRATFAYLDKKQEIEDNKAEQVENLIARVRIALDVILGLEADEMDAIEFEGVVQNQNATPPKMALKFEVDGLGFKLYLDTSGDPRLDFNTRGSTYTQVKSLADLGEALKKP